jgi:tRNA-2-methylthio-N6-dimethylallyladenosine synthase
MNEHDSERLAGALVADGLVATPDLESADVVVFNTCCIRENADNKFYGHLGNLKTLRENRPGMQIAVGGCLAQMDKDRVRERASHVDVVFGTHNLTRAPALLRQAAASGPVVEILDGPPAGGSGDDDQVAALAAVRDLPYAAWVTIQSGCDNSCAFCIVPQVRGGEVSRAPDDLVSEVRALSRRGVCEVTLLGQNVNSYGAEFGDRLAFGKLLRACGGIEGLERIRFTSPHPRDFTEDVIAAMAETPNVMPSLHMPLQSGSDTMLKAMRRAYRRDRYLAILDNVRSRIPDAAITTDIIVGFPGETDQDFEDTLDLVRQARFAGAFTFRYSIRPGTPAATMDQQVPASVVQERYERLTAEVDAIIYEENQRQAGATVEVLVAEGEGRKDTATHRRSGRARDNRLVHFAPHGSTPRSGDVVTVKVTRGAPHYLLADDAPLSVRRTHAGDAAAAAAAKPAVAAVPAPVLLGMPQRG